jgi:hypothetical protein
VRRVDPGRSSAGVLRFARSVAPAAALSLTLVAGACRPDPDRAGVEDPEVAGESVARAELPSIDIEPNDRFDRAVPVGEGGTGELTPGDVDVYTLAAGTGPRLVRLEASPAGSATVEALHRSESLPETVAPARTQLVVGEEETFLVVRSPRGREASYALRVTPLELPDVGLLALEPNHVGRPLTVDRLPARVAGFYDGPGDTDVVRLRGLRSARPFAAEVSPMAGHRPVLRVLGPNGVVLGSASAARSGEGTGIPNLAPLEGTEELILEVSDADGETSSRPWTLSLHSLDLGPLGEREPNDTAETAQRLQLSQGRLDVTGLFHKADDLDVFALQVNEPGALTLTLSPEEGVDASLTWQPPNAPPLRSDAAGPGEPEQLCARQAEPGRHLIEVAARSLPGVLGRYRLTGVLEHGRFEREPNDTPGAEGVMALRDNGREGVRGFLHSPGDVDVWTLSFIGAIDADETRRIVVEPPPGLDVAIEVLDDEGAPVVPRTDAAGPGQREVVVVPLRNMVYHLVVRVGAGGGANCESAYTLRVEDRR